MSTSLRPAATKCPAPIPRPSPSPPTARIYKLEADKFDPVVHYNEESEINEKMSQALIKSLEWGNKIPIGVFYKNEIISRYSERLTDEIPNYLENPPAKQAISSNGRPITDVSKLLDSFEV